MTAYLLRRLLVVPFTLFGMSVVVFVFVQFLDPESRAAYYLQNPPKNPAVLEGIIKRYGLRDPIPQQYWNWMFGKADPETGEVEGGLLRGNFGYSRFSVRPVAELMRLRFPATLELALYSLAPILFLGIWLGVRTALDHNRGIDQTVRIVSIVCYSIPGFVLGLMLLMVFYAQLKLFPVGRISDWVRLEELNGTFALRTGMYTVDSLLAGRPDIWWDAVRHLVLPVTTLSFISTAAFLRITRSSVLEALHQDYIVTARAKGLGNDALVYRHALPNALLPVVTYAGLIAAGLMSGVVVTETIFQFQGMGYAAAEAASQFDIVTVLGFTMLAGVSMIAVNLAVDILYARVDPRIQLR
jgi:ABC-type dipeptide/oligopeptide/nickel transport system permease component